jgi:hypothetical protein
MVKERHDDDPKEDEFEEDYEAGEEEAEGDFADSDLEFDDEEIALDEGDVDEDADEDVVSRVAPKRRPPVKAAPTIEGVAKTKLEKPDVCADVWTKLSAKYGDNKQIPYTISARLAKWDHILHKNFGAGFVIDISSPTRAEVLFRDALRKLVHSR